uniref:Cytochrome P450 n=1 Tax=Bionectria ochroleuca TaxID=29856 RepID=A0A8H7TMJ1_BIOOC
MILEHLGFGSLKILGLALLAGLLFCGVFNKYGHGLHNIPGPWIAGFSDLWRLFLVRRRHAQEEHIALHQKYGPIVRLGPRVVSIADPDAIKTIYSPSAGWSKSQFYPVQQALAKGKRLETMFNTANDRYHAKLRRSVSNSYAMSTLVAFEPFVDSTSIEFLKQLKTRFVDKPGEDGICDFGAWLQFYAFDVIGELTFSKRLGFVEKGADVDNIIRDLESFLDYVSWVGQIPFLDNLLIKNPLKLWAAQSGLINTSAPVAQFARKHITKRQNDESLGEENSRRGDFLNRFKEARAKDPDFITEQLVLALTVANMFAGSDTTGITMRAVFYFLLKNPSTMNSLLAEISEKSKAGGSPERTAFRMGLTLERMVPANGVKLAGYFLPGGTIAGCSAWVLHQSTDVYGKDAADFRPERWLEATTEQRRKMNNTLFSFGAGARTCIGKNISLLELYKLVPAILRRFELELAHPEASWKTHNAWFVRQREFYVRLKERKQIL